MEYDFSTVKTFQIARDGCQYCYFQISPENGIHHSLMLRASLSPDMCNVIDTPEYARSADFIVWSASDKQTTRHTDVFIKDGSAFSSGPWILNSPRNFHFYWRGIRVLTFRKPYIPMHNLQFGLNTYLCSEEGEFTVIPRSDLIFKYQYDLRFKCELDAGNFYITLGAMKKQEDSSTGYTPFMITCSRTPTIPANVSVLTFCNIKLEEGSYKFSSETECAVQRIMIHKPKVMTLCIDAVPVLKIEELPQITRLLEWNSGLTVTEVQQ